LIFANNLSIFNDFTRFLINLPYFAFIYHHHNFFNWFHFESLLDRDFEKRNFLCNRHYIDHAIDHSPLSPSRITLNIQDVYGRSNLTPRTCFTGSQDRPRSCTCPYLQSVTTVWNSTFTCQTNCSDSWETVSAQYLYALIPRNSDEQDHLYSKESIIYRGKSRRRILITIQNFDLSKPLCVSLCITCMCQICVELSHIFPINTLLKISWRHPVYYSIAYIQWHAFDARGDKKLFIDTASFRSCNIIRYGRVVWNSWSRTAEERTRGQKRRVFLPRVPVDTFPADDLYEPLNKLTSVRGAASRDRHGRNFHDDVRRREYFLLVVSRGVK